MSDSASMLSLSVLFNGDRILSLPPLAQTIDVATIKMIIGTEVSERERGCASGRAHAGETDQAGPISLGLVHRERMSSARDDGALQCRTDVLIHTARVVVRSSCRTSLQTNVSGSSIVLLYKQVVLTDGQTLAQLGIRSDEMLEARAGAAVRPPTQQQGGQRPAQQAQQSQNSGAQRSTNSLGIPDAILHDPARAREFIRANPQLLFSIESQNAPLYQAIIMNDLAPFAAMWERIVANIEAERQQEQERFRLANADPMGTSAQRACDAGNIALPRASRPSDRGRGAAHIDADLSTRTRCLCQIPRFKLVSPRRFA
jgi:hypothetical protein